MFKRRKGGCVGLPKKVRSGERESSDPKTVSSYRAALKYALKALPCVL